MYNLLKKYLYKIISKTGLTKLTIILIGIFIFSNTLFTYIYNQNIKESKFTNYKNFIIFFKNKKIKKAYFIRNINTSVDMVILLKNKKIISIPSGRFYEKYLFENNIPYIWLKRNQITNISELKNLKQKKNYLIIKRPEIIFNLLLMLLVMYILEHSGMINIGLNNKFKLIFPEDIKGSIKELIGLNEVKKEIESLKFLIKHNNNHYKNFNILFSGPAGVGKTKMASYIAKELNIPMIIGTGNLETGYVAGGVNIIKNLFDSANEIATAFDHRCLIFLDEAQVLLLKRNQQNNNSSKWEDDTTNELLSNLDGINSRNDNNQIIFIAASNFDDSNINMDEAIERRFQKKIFFRLPNINEREELFKFYLLKYNIDLKNINIDYLSKITSKLSPAKIEVIIKETLLYKNFKTDITTEDLIKTFEIVTIGHTTKIKNREKEREIVIIHELGHFFTYYHFLKEKYKTKKEIIKNLKTLKISSESIEKYGVLGFVFNSEDNNNLKSLKEIEEEIIQLYGGVASEEYFLGKENITIGSFNDIEKITNLLNLLINKLNIYKNSKINYTMLLSNHNYLKYKVEQLEYKSEELYKKSLKIIKIYEKEINIFKEILKEKWILSKPEIEQLIKEKL